MMVVVYDPCYNMAFDLKQSLVLNRRPWKAMEGRDGLSVFRADGSIKFPYHPDVLVKPFYDLSWIIR